MAWTKSCNRACGPCDRPCETACDPYWDNGCGGFWVFFIVFLFLILILAGCSQGYRYYYVKAAPAVSQAGQMEQFVVVDMNKKSNTETKQAMETQVPSEVPSDPHLEWVGTDAMYE